MGAYNQFSVRRVELEITQKESLTREPSPVLASHPSARLSAPIRCCCSSVHVLPKEGALSSWRQKSCVPPPARSDCVSAFAVDAGRARFVEAAGGLAARDTSTVSQHANNARAN